MFIYLKVNDIFSKITSMTSLVMGIYLMMVVCGLKGPRDLNLGVDYGW
jgi:hypothetical protein